MWKRIGNFIINRTIKPLLVVLLIPLFIAAAELNFSASVDRTTVGLGEDFTLNVSVTGENIGGVPAPELPPLPDFNVLNRSSSQSTNIQIINGKMNQQTTINYIFYLSPQKLGKFTIGPCKLKYQDKTYETRPIEIEVIKGATKTAPAPQTNLSPAPATVPVEGNLMLVATASRKTVYLGEQINVEYSLYTRLQISDLNPAQMPSFSGFWAEKIYDATKITFQRRNINGKIYDVALLKKAALFPMTCGELHVDPMALNITVVEPPRDFFDFFGRARTVRLESKPITINVLPLPQEQRPAEFTGGVGSFKIQSELNRTTSHGGEPINLVVKISGTGNIRLIEKPSIPTIQGLRILDPEVKEDIQASSGIVQGFKEFCYPIIPQIDGNYLIPPIRIAYFDPKRKVYETSETEKLAFNATGTVQAAQALESGGLKILGSDINYIKPEVTKLESKSSGPIWWLIIFYPLSGLIVILSLWYRNHQARLLLDRGYARRVKCGRLVKKKLKEVASHLKKKDEKEFYASLSQAILGYVGDRYNLETHALTREQLKIELKNRGVEETAIEDFTEIIEQCDIARFSPALMTFKNPQELFEKSKEILNKI